MPTSQISEVVQYLRSATLLVRPLAARPQFIPYAKQPHRQKRRS
jgi:hypothetical protein